MYYYTMSKIDFLAIGDIVTDAFIRLKDAEVHCKINQADCELCVRFGDKVPYESVDVVRAVGNSPNASVSAARLGLTSCLVANVGDDQNGKECLESLRNDGVITDHIITENGKKTNYHYVLLYEVDRTILIKHTEFDYKMPELEEVGFIYLSSLAENSLPFHDDILAFLEKHPETKLAFQPGTFQMKLGVDKLKKIYERADIFFCNVEEAERILGIETKDVLELSKGIQALGPKMVSISDGPKGSYFYNEGELWHIPMYPDTGKAIDRTGAGDAFSSTFTSALALGLPPTEAFAWGPINSMSVVQKIGAQAGLLTREKLEELLKNAPEEYKPKKVN